MKNKEIEVNDAKMYMYFEDEAHKLFSKLCPTRGTNQRRPNQLTSYGVERIYKSLKVIYETDDVKEELCLIENVLNILEDYVQIEGMEHLLINNYSSIENGIFLEHSPEGNPKRIREHYKHQFRNAYLGLLMLDKLHMDDSIVKCILDEGNEYSYFIISSLNNNDDMEIEKQLKEIIYKSYFISALFHDIGYPLAYYFRMADEIHEFTPFFNIINPMVKTEFTQIKAMLNNSLLFRTIGHKAIRHKYHENDHGCLSALSFLMNFYFSGYIYKLTAKERCIVEIAAVAIYKHTDRYDGDSRMIFSRDPISYMLRICDDMQEWQRFLIMIDRSHNFLQCSECGKVVRPSKEKLGLYACGCGKQFYKITHMNNKKVNYINICDGLILSMSDNNITVKFVYNIYSQLELLISDYQAVFYRHKGLQELKQMVRFQKYLPEMKLKYCLSNNPIVLIDNLIKESNKTLQDIKEWADAINSPEKRKNMCEFIKQYEAELSDSGERFGKPIENNAVCYAKRARQFVEDYLGEIYMLKEYLS